MLYSNFQTPLSLDQLFQIMMLFILPKIHLVKQFSILQNQFLYLFNFCEQFRFLLQFIWPSSIFLSETQIIPTSIVESLQIFEKYKLKSIVVHQMLYWSIILFIFCDLCLDHFIFLTHWNSWELFKSDFLISICSLPWFF